MLTTTIQAIGAVLRMDTTITSAERVHILSRLKNPEEPMKHMPTREARILRRKEVAERLGRSLRLVDRLVVEGVLQKVTLPGRKRACGFREVDVETLLNCRDAEAVAAKKRKKAQGGRDVTWLTQIRNWRI